MLAAGPGAGGAEEGVVGDVAGDGGGVAVVCVSEFGLAGKEILFIFLLVCS